jgi:hypothetical protein
MDIVEPEAPNLFSFFPSFSFMIYLKGNHLANAVWIIIRIKGGQERCEKLRFLGDAGGGASPCP